MVSNDRPSRSDWKVHIINTVICEAHRPPRERDLAGVTRELQARRLEKIFREILLLLVDGLFVRQSRGYFTARVLACHIQSKSRPRSHSGDGMAC